MVTNKVNMERKVKGGAKKIVFEKRDGKVCVKIAFIANKGMGANINDNKYGNGYIRISNKVIEDAQKWGLLTNVGRGVSKAENIFYMANRVGYTGLYLNRAYGPHNCTLLCTDIINSNYRAYQLMDSDIDEMRCISENNTYMNNVNGNKFREGRHFCKSTVNKKPVHTPLILNFLKGRIPCIEGYEPHHIYAPWDMRDASVVALRSEKHEKYHSDTGKENHRLDVEINTVEELVAFLDFVESDNYKRMYMCK